MPDEDKDKAGREPLIKTVTPSASRRLYVNLFLTAIIVGFASLVFMAFTFPFMPVFIGFLVMVLAIRGMHLLFLLLMGRDHKEPARRYREHLSGTVAIICFYAFARGLGDILWWLKSGELYFGSTVSAGAAAFYLILGIFCLLVTGSYTMLDFVWRSRHIIQLENIPTSKIRSAAMGLVELRGRAEHYGKPLSPFVISSDGIRPFYLEDDTGRILVDPGDCEARDHFFWFNSIIRTAFSMGTMLGIREVVLRAKAIPSEMGGPGATIESYNYVVQPGDTLYVIGTLEKSDLTDNETLVVRARKSPGISRRKMVSGVISGDLDYWNVFFVSDSDELTAKKLMKRGRMTILTIGGIITLGGLFILWEGVWGLALLV